MRVVPAGSRLAQRRIPGRRQIVAGCTAAVAVMLLASCQSSGTSSQASQAPPGSSITVASVPGVGNAPLYIALQQGLFQKAGLSVYIRSYPSVADEIRALRTGKADVAVGDYADFFYAQERYAHSPMVIVADGYDAGPNVMNVLVNPRSNITDAQELAGKTIGAAASPLMPDNISGQPFSLETVAASSVLTNDGVQPTAVTWKPMAAQDLIGALKSHQVDAILVSEPQLFQAESTLGAESVLDACSGQTLNLPLDGYFASASFAKQEGAALAAFRSALKQAQVDAASATPVEAALRHYAGMPAETASLVTIGVYPTGLNAANLQRVADLMNFYGALPQPLTVANMVFR
jgi:NitT/TauT family transport system substrate-binding protein